MKSIVELEQDLVEVRFRITDCKNEYSVVKKSLTNIETFLIEAREDERKILSQLEKIRSETIDIDSLDVERQDEIDGFRRRMDLLLLKDFRRISHAYLTRSLTRARREL